MNKIEQLTKQIQSIEEEAGQLDVHDYESLYKLLAVAYFAAKDIIELQQGNLPIVEDNASKVAYNDLQDALDVALTNVNAITMQLDEANNKIKDFDEALCKCRAESAHYCATISSIEQLIADAK